MNILPTQCEGNTQLRFSKPSTLNPSFLLSRLRLCLVLTLKLLSIAIITISNAIYIAGQENKPSKHNDRPTNIAAQFPTPTDSPSVSNHDQANANHGEATPTPADEHTRLPAENSWFNFIAGLCSILGSLLAIIAIIVALLIYQRQGAEQGTLAEEQKTEFRILTEQQTGQFKSLTDQQTKQFEALARELSYEVHPIKPDEALSLVGRWFADDNLVNIEFFSTFTVVPLFWTEEHRTSEAIRLLSNRSYRDKIKLIGPSKHRSEKDFEDVATFLVNRGIEAMPENTRVLNWMADALQKMGKLERKESTSPNHDRLVALLIEIKSEQDNSPKLIQHLTDVIASDYHRYETLVAECVYYREQASNLTVNYALARFAVPSSTETFEMLVFADPEGESFEPSVEGTRRPEQILSEPSIYRTKNRLLMRAIREPVKTILMKVNQEQVEHITLWNIQPNIDAEPAKGTVLILPNVYGILAYQEQLSSALAARGWEAYWFAFSGQKGTTGTLTFGSATKELSTVINYIKGKPQTGSLSVIAHGAGSIAIFDYLREDPQRCADIERLIVMGMVFNLARVAGSDLNEMDKHKVSAEYTEEEIKAYSPLPALKVISIPILFCHAKDSRHFTRASQEEMGEVQRTAQGSKLLWFERGYDESLEVLPEFVEAYVSWLSSNRP